jgi:hypothetical protein
VEKPELSCITDLGQGHPGFAYVVFWLIQQTSESCLLHEKSVHMYSNFVPTINELYGQQMMQNWKKKKIIWKICLPQFGVHISTLVILCGSAVCTLFALIHIALR